MKCPHCSSTDTNWKSKAAKWECNSCEERFEATSCPKCDSLEVVWKSKANTWECSSCEARFEDAVAPVAEVPDLPAESKSAFLPPPADSAKPKIFLSYGRKDSFEVAKRLERDLEAAGYEVWMDVKKIGSGSIWQQEIENGLREAQVVVSLLSPHAVRRVGESHTMDSVCLDELTFARTSSPPTPVVPAMVLPCEPPFIIYRLDYVHLTGWQQSEQSYQAGLTRLIEGIREALAGKVRYRVWEDRLRPLDFSDYMAQKRKGFVGREWMFEEIDLWRFESDERALLITGDPGAGKSSIVAQLVHANPGGQVIAYHCCQSNEINTLRPAKFVQSLAAMIASRLPDYAAQFDVPSVSEALDDKRCEADPGGAFLEGILQPLQKLAAPDEGVRYILVDALDEALGHSGTTNIFDVLASRLERLPAWLRIVATTRNEPGVIQGLSGLRAKSINASDPRNLEDLATYIRQRLQEPSLAERLVESRMGADAVVESLSRKSSGNFLYAVNALDGISRDFYSFANLDALPRGLDGLYLDFFRRIFGREGTDAGEATYKKAKPLLQILCAAAEPLSRAELAAASNLDPDEDLPRVLRQLAQLLSKRVRSNGEETIELYHKSIADWLTTNLDFNAFAVSPTKGRKLLAEFCRGALAHGRSKLDWYVRRHAVEHFLEVEDWDSATAALSNLEFIEARAVAQELPAMLKDYVEVINSLPNGHCSFNTLQSFRVFVATNAAPLQKYSIQEGFAYNLAINNAPAGPVHNEGKNRLVPLQCAKAIRQFSSGAVINSLPACQAILEVGPVASKLDQFAVAVNIEHRISVSGYDNGVLKVWNLDSGECIKFLEAHPSAVTSVALSEDGQLAVSGYNDGIVKIWKLDSCECIKVLEAHIHEYIDPLNPDWQEMGITSNIESILSDEDRRGIFSGQVSALSLSADGRFLVSGSLGGNIRVWHLESGVCLKYLEDHSDAINALAINNNGLIVSGSADQTLRARSRDYNWILTGHTNTVASVAVSDGGDFAVSGSKDKTLRVWNLDTGECTKVLEGHTNFVTSVAVSSDLRIAVSGSEDKTLRVWNLESGECIKVLQGHSDSAFILALSADGRVAVSGSCDETLRIWNLESTEMLDFPKNSSRAVKCIVTSQDGQVAISNSGNELRVWSLESSECMRILAGHTESVSSIVISEDGRTVASTSFDNTLRVWNLESGECLQVLEGLNDLMTWLSSSSSQRIVISDRRIFCIDDDTLRVWDLQSGECLAVLRHKGMVESLAVSADRRLAVSGKDNGSIDVWNLETYECIKVLEGHKNLVASVAVSSDGHYAVSGGYDRTLRIWNLISGDCLKSLEGHTGCVSVLALSANGRFVISGSKDKTLRVWNLKSGECVQILQGHHGEISSVSVSADSRFAISESGDESLRIWNLESGECCGIIYARGMTKAAINWQIRKIIIGYSFNQVEFFKIENLPLGSHS